MEEVNDAKDEQSLKAERVQIWEQVVDASRSIAERIYAALAWAEALISSVKAFFGRDPMER